MSLNYDPDKIDHAATFKRNDFPDGVPIKGTPRILVFLDGTEMDTTIDPPVDVAEHLQKRRKPAAAKATPFPVPGRTKVDPLPAGVIDEPEVKPEEAQEPMPSKPRAQNLPGTTASAGPPILREIPLEQIHEAVEKNLYEQGVEIRIHYKNARGVPTYIGLATVQLEQLTELEAWLRDQIGGGTFRIDARDPVTRKRALPIPVFEVTIHAPMRLSPNGTVLPAGVSPQFSSPVAAAQGQPPMSGNGFQGPWTQPAPGLVPPFVPGNQAGQSPWFHQQAMPANPYGGAHHVPVMSMPPDAIAMAELTKAQTALDRERSAHQRQIAEMSKRLESLAETLADQRLKEEDRARQHESQQLREQMRRMEEGFKAALDQERTRRPAFDLTAVVGIVSAIVPVITTMISSRGDQTSKSLELQATGVNNLMKATLERSDSKWLEKLLAALPVMLPAVSPMLKLWAEQKSPAAQADLVATLSENHLTALGMMAKFMNEMAGSGPDQPAWLPVFQQMSSTILSSIDAMVNSNKASVGLPVKSRHMPAPPVPQSAPQVQGLTPAQVASGMQTPGQTYPQTMPQSAPTPAVSSIGGQIAQVFMNTAEVPADLKTPEFFKIVEDLHNQVPSDDVATEFANLMRTLGDKVPQVFAEMWTTDDPDTLFSGVFANLPIWQWNNTYARAFVAKAVDILTTPATIPADLDFFKQPAVPVA